MVDHLGQKVSCGDLWREMVLGRGDEHVFVRNREGLRLRLGAAPRAWICGRASRPGERHGSAPATPFAGAALSRARPQAPPPLGWLGLRPNHPPGLLEIVMGKEEEKEEERYGRTRSRSHRLRPESVRSSVMGKNARSRMTEQGRSAS